MSSLYQLTSDFENLFEQFDAIANCEFTPDGNGGFTDDDGNSVDPAAARSEMLEAWFDTLDGMEAEIQSKAEAVAVYIKNITAEAGNIKCEEDALKARRKAKENSAERLKKYLADCLEAAKIKKIDMPRAVISIRNNAESVQISDEVKFALWAEKNNPELLRFKAPEINKNAVKSALKGNEEIPFAELTRTQSIIIK